MTNGEPRRGNRGTDPAVVIDGGTDARLSAAGLWARATALRDGLPQPVPAGDKLPGIEAALANEGAQLLLAHTASTAVGFAVVVPSRSAMAQAVSNDVTRCLTSRSPAPLPATVCGLSEFQAWSCTFRSVMWFGGLTSRSAEEGPAHDFVPHSCFAASGHDR